MTSVAAFWSEQAHRDFAGIFDGEGDRPRLRELVADALNRGWGGNRDKPFWALAILAGLIGEARARDRRIDELALLSQSSSRLWALLSAWAASNPSTRVKLDEGRIIVTPGEGSASLAVTRSRIEILRKVVEFLLVCDEFKFAQETMSALQALSRLGLSDPAAVAEHGRRFARAAYRYRTDHFLDGHASSAFSLILRFLQSQGDYEMRDDSVVDFWIWEENEKYRTYKASFHALADFVAAMRDVAEARGLAHAVSIDDPGIEARMREIEGESVFTIMDEASLIHDAPAEGERVGEASGPAAALRGSTLKVLSTAELRLLEQLLEIGSFGREHVLASLRLIGFHPVQSGLSNSLRTGRSKLSLDERLTCVEAIPYRQTAARSVELGHRLSEILKMALAQRLPANPSDARVARIREEGVLLLADFRGGARWKTAGAELETWMQIEPALIEAQSQLDVFNRSLARRAATTLDDLDAAFEQDRVRFSGILSERYGAGGQASSRAEIAQGAAPDRKAEESLP